jgi:hypothetical protein
VFESNWHFEDSPEYPEKQIYKEIDHKQGEEEAFRNKQLITTLNESQITMSMM